MAECSYCNSMVSPNARFCPKCGEPDPYNPPYIPPPPPPPPAETGPVWPTVIGVALLVLGGPAGCMYGWTFAKPNDSIGLINGGAIGFFGGLVAGGIALAGLQWITTRLEK